jgi:hypothetical protein
MKKVLFILLATAVIGLSACSDQSTNGPDNTAATSTQLSKAISNFNVTTSQMSVLDEMYYLNEDLSTLLTPKQLNTFNTLSVNFDGGPGGPGNPRFPMMDMGFLMQLRLIFQANPDMDEGRKTEFTNLMQAYQDELKLLLDKYRTDPTLDPAQLREELKALRDKYQQQLDGMLTDVEKQNVADLKAKIEAERQAMREKMAELRLQRQVEMWTKILGLTPDQVSTLTEILKARDAAIQAARTEFATDPAGFRAQLILIQDQFNADIKTKLGLTEEQIALWERLMQHMGRGGKGGMGGGGTGGGRG